MSETSVMIKAGENLLESLLEKGEVASVVAVICHPHPLYGGSMDNGVVSTVQKSLRKWGWGTLRFNFRGVGRSTGTYGDGEKEAEDVQSVASYLFEQGVKELHLAGYSFGAWVVLKALELGLEPASLILISPPIDFMEFSHLKLSSKPSLITLGDRDDFCSFDSLQKWLAVQPSVAGFTQVEALPNCDHFYGGNDVALADKISEFLRRNFKRGAA
ncbi:MAG: hypothetical protein RBS57_07100 [Desulforhabdus sp.]|jgi:alpha/beta superfamily hydrolase|nr:hypothetical protein [Desulforhabdus sp.]